MEAVAGAWRTDLGEETRPNIRNKHRSNSQQLHRHEQSYPRTDMTSQTQRLLLISVYPSDWVCFMPLCVNACVCVRVCAHSSASVSACACMSARIGAPVFVCMCVSVHVCVKLSWFPLIEVGSTRLSSPRRRGRGRQNKHAHTLTHIQAQMNSFKKKKMGGRGGAYTADLHPS